MKKIFILSEGSYSDFHIVGAAEDKETAELLSEKWDCGYEEYKLNTREDAKYIQNKTLYNVTVWENGNSEVEKYCSQEGDARQEPVFCFWDGMYVGIEPIVIINCWADSPEHAVKIANEKRIQMMADGTWNREVEKITETREEYFKQNRRPVLNKDGVCGHPYSYAARYHKDGKVYKIIRCRYCFEIVREEKD